MNVCHEFSVVLVMKVAPVSAPHATCHSLVPLCFPDSRPGPLACTNPPRLIIPAWFIPLISSSAYQFRSYKTANCIAWSYINLAAFNYSACYDFILLYHLFPIVGIKLYFVMYFQWALLIYGPGLCLNSFWYSCVTLHQWCYGLLFVSYMSYICIKTRQLLVLGSPSGPC